jgi:hypothetical protein
MEARVPELARNVCVVLMVGIGIMLSACATQKQPARLVDDPDAKQESAIPWNKQETWEAGAELGPVAGQTGSDRR